MSGSYSDILVAGSELARGRAANGKFDGRSRGFERAGDATVVRAGFRQVAIVGTAAACRHGGMRDAPLERLSSGFDREVEIGVADRHRLARGSRSGM